jgi:dCTP diphosphatase
VTLEELHARVRAFVDARDWGRFHSPRNLAMALSVEAGELLEVWLWTPDDAPPTAERTAQAADEAADVMICLLNLCARADIDLGAAVVTKLAKAEAKYPAERVRGSALKYDRYASWDGAGHTAVHRIDAEGLPRDLPSDAARLLSGPGLPADGRLPGDRRFASSLGDGRLRNRPDGYAIGEVRQGDTVVAEVVVRVPSGTVSVADATWASLGAFVEALG